MKQHLRQLLLVFTLIAATSACASYYSEWVFIKSLLAQTEHLQKGVLQKALTAFHNAQKTGITDNQLLTIIDYSRPSTEPRLWVFDMGDKPELLYEELVAHGRGSGENYASKFSNKPNSYQSSVGLFITQEPYMGRNGYSLRMEGLEDDFNHLARQRAIVFHGAHYVSPSIIKKQGRLGRSLGCPAVSQAVNKELINTIKGGSLVFIYGPDKTWLAESEFLNPPQEHIKVSALTGF